MLIFRVDKWLRVGSGLAVLLLLAAQEKLWPAPPPEAADDAKPGKNPADKDKHPRLPVLQLLPDAPAPRWPAQWGQALSRETTGARDGVHTRGPREIASAGPLQATPAEPAYWHVFRLTPEPGALLSQSPARAPAAPAVLTAICQTGPPLS